MNSSFSWKQVAVEQIYSLRKSHQPAKPNGLPLTMSWKLSRFDLVHDRWTKIPPPPIPGESVYEKRPCRKVNEMHYD